MEQIASSKLNFEEQLLLEQPSLRLPIEAQRANAKKAARDVEITQSYVLKKLKEVASTAQTAGPEGAAAAIAALDNLEDKLAGLQKRFQALREEERTYNAKETARLKHLAELQKVQSFADVKYELWSKVRLYRLFVDHLLRTGYAKSARALAESKGIEELVDLNVFQQCLRVENSLRQKHSTAEALAWCNEYKALRKQGGELEFHLRLQQFIDFRREDEPGKAREHAQRYLANYHDTFKDDVQQAAGLLAHGPDTLAEPYKSLYSQSRWAFLADLFVKTHHSMFNLPERPLLEMALGAGISALKTPICAARASGSASSGHAGSKTSECPICSKELGELSRPMPHNMRSQSWIMDDPVVLPNGRLHGRDKVMAGSAKAKFLAKGQVADPVTGEVFSEDQVKKVYVA